MITQKYNLDLVPSGVPVIVHVSQYDSDSRTIQMDIYEDGVAYEIPSTAIVTVRGTKADNTGFEYTCSADGNRASFLVKEQMTIFKGKVPCELRISNNGNIVGTANFILAVEETPMDSTITISETELPLLEEAVQASAQAQSYAQSAQQSASQAQTVLSTAVKSVNSVTPDAQGNVDVVALPTGGTQGQYLVKQSSTDGDADWETRVVELTQAQYNAITPDPNVTYYITDSNVNPSTASNITYDNTSSGLSASTVQTAIDELNNNISTYEDFTSNVTMNESVANSTKFQRMGNIVHINYQGEGKTHAISDVLFVLPSGYAPPTTQTVPFVVNTLGVGLLFIDSSGNAIINQIESSAQTSGRVYFNITYFI